MQLLTQQQQAFDKLHRLKVGALFMDPGTGKTRTGCELVRSTNCNCVEWFTPFQTKQNLQDEINKCGGLPNLTITGIESIQNSDRIYFETLKRVQEGNTFLIMDESIKIKNADAKRTRRAFELAKYAAYKLVLNGTPITRNLLDVWSQIQFLSPKILNMSLAEFTSTFCETVKVTKRINGNRPVTREYIAKFHNVDYLYSLIKHYVFECDLQLSVDQKHTQIDYTLSYEEFTRYQELKEKYLDNELLQILNNNIFIEMTQKMQHEYCCTEDKFKKLEAELKAIDPERVIVYTKFIRSREELQKRYPKLQVLSYGKHALGLNLQKYNHTIYWDQTFDYGQMTQSEFRTYRTGQESNCSYATMIGNVGLERMIHQNIFKKQSLLEYFKKVGAEQIIKEL